MQSIPRQVNSYSIETAVVTATSQFSAAAAPLPPPPPPQIIYPIRILKHCPFENEAETHTCNLTDNTKQ